MSPEWGLKSPSRKYSLAFMTSCSDDKETCADCHLVVMNADGSETELLDLEEYCGDDLHDFYCVNVK